MPSRRTTKVTVVGGGAVGIAICTVLTAGDRCSELVIYDVDTKKLHGNVLDLQQAGNFHRVRISAANGWESTAESDVCVITAGARQMEGESRLSLLGRNAKIMASIVPPFCALSPDAVIIVVSNPCDIMAALCLKMSGFPPNRVFGSGTYLDSSRLRSTIAEEVGCSPSRVHTLVVGEHGDSSVMVSSTATVGGVHVTDIISAARLKEMHKAVVCSAAEIIKAKGYTDIAVGFTVAAIVDMVLQDSRDVIPVSTSVQGMFGIDRPVFLSIPCVIGAAGIEKKMPIRLDGEEMLAMQKSAKSVGDAQDAMEEPVSKIEPVPKPTTVSCVELMTTLPVPPATVSRGVA